MARVSACLLALGSVCGCGTTGVNEGLPDWCLCPKKSDSLYVYSLGQATGQPTPEAAKDAAYKIALSAISKAILSEVKIDKSGTDLTSGSTIRGAEIMPECIYLRQTHGGWSGCVLMSIGGIPPRPTWTSSSVPRCG